MKGFRSIILAVGLALVPFAALSQSAQDSGGPTPPAGAQVPAAPLSGCTFLGTSPAALIASYQGHGLQCGANGALNVNVVTQPAGGVSTVTANQGAAGTAPWLTTIYQGGSALSNSNPIFTQVTNFPTTQAVTNAGTFAVQNTAPIPAGTNAIGAVSLLDTRSTATLNTATTSSPLIIPVPQGASTFSFNTQGLTASGATISILGSADNIAWGPVTVVSRNGNGSQPTGINVDQTNSPIVPVAGLQSIEFTVTAAGTSSTTINYAFSEGSVPSTFGAVSSAKGGIQSFSRIESSAATTNLTNAKTTAGRVYKIFACNTTTTPARIKFFNAASTGAVTVGTTVPYFTRAIPPAASGGLACASYDVSDIGWYFSTGITYAITVNPLYTDTTAVAAGAITDISVEYQ